VFNLCTGLLCWLIYRRREHRPSGLLFLLLAITGIYTFLGNLFGTALGGDIHILATLLNASGNLRYALSAAGFLSISVFMFSMGRELIRWIPGDAGHAQAVAFATIVPWIIGSVLTLLIYWPLPAFLAGPNLVASVFWVFAVAGAALRRKPAPSAAVSPIRRSDVVFGTIVVIVVRLLVPGIHLTP
jgi:hypothetical protein